MNLRHRKLIREWKTAQAMIEIFCRGHHSPQPEHLCLSCGTLLSYVGERLQKCPFKEKKPACAECAVHCYQTEKRKAIIEVMRYAGPRMIWRHPWMALRHMFRGFGRRSSVRG